MAADPTAFSVWHRDEKENLDFRYPADHPFVKVVETCINICQKMLRHPDTQRAFVALGERLEKAHPGATASYEGNMEKKTKDFFGILFTQFPTVIVGYTLREPNFMACTERPVLNTAFDPRLQWINVNGQVSSKLVEILTEVLE